MRFRRRFRRRRYGKRLRRRYRVHRGGIRF